MRATLFGLPASHPTLAAELMLRHKGIDYRRIDFFPAVHRGILRALGFPGVTVPAVRLDGAKVQGTGRIALALDALVPDPPLFPADPERRRAVEEAEAWGDEVLQPGVIGAAERNAADFQIATSISLLLTMDDVRPMIEGRPAERLARDVVQHQPGHTPSVYAT
jgi:glutathione S-transferase